MGGVRQQSAPAAQPRRRTWHKVALIILAGVMVGGATLYIANRSYRNAIYTRANTMAAAFDSQRIADLKQPGANANDSSYQYYKTKLQQIKQANRDLHFVYLMGQQSTGSVYFLADSEVPGSEGFSALGDPYPEASVQLKNSFSNGRTFLEGPTHDSYGTWLSALAPVRAADGTIVAVLGIDVPASFYIAYLALAGGIPLLIAGFIAGLVWLRDAARRRHRESLEFRAEMVSIASHELRTPLTGLRWGEEGLLKAALSKPQHQTLQTMYESTLQLQESIEDILQLANLGAGQARQLQLMPTDLRELLRAVVATQQPAADRHGIRIVYAGHWPERIAVTADAMRLKRVLNNLVSNAIKYGGQDTTVELQYKHGREGHRIAVVDHGLGIPVAEQAKVFGGFYRASNVLRTDISGTGMGLYISRAIIEQHGGKVWFTSHENRGTTVYVQLPAAHDQ